MSAEVFREELKEKARLKRELRFEAFKTRKELINATKHKELGIALSEIRTALQTLAELIVSRGGEKSGPVTFVVNERDVNGKIKSFRIER